MKYLIFIVVLLLIYLWLHFGNIVRKKQARAGLKAFYRLFFRNWYISFAKSKQHMIYINDLTINLGELNFLLMWKLTDYGKTVRVNYLSFNVYYGYKQKLKIHI